MFMSKIRKNNLYKVIKETIIVEQLKPKQVQKEISSVIFRFKKELRKRKISCRTNFFSPDPEDRYGDFGALEVSIDISCGRSKDMTNRAIEKFVRIIADKTGLLKFFSFSGSGENTERFDVDFDLKTKYVNMFIKDDLPLNIIDLENNEEKNEPEALSKHIRLS